MLAVYLRQSVSVRLGLVIEWTTKTLLSSSGQSLVREFGRQSENKSRSFSSMLRRFVMLNQ